MIYALISLCLTLLMLALSLIFKVAGKLRLSIPLLYIILMITVFRNWASANETLSVGILIGIVALCLISWIVSLVRTIRDRRSVTSLFKQQLRWMKQAGIPNESVVFIDGIAHYKDTGEPVMF